MLGLSTGRPGSSRHPCPYSQLLRASVWAAGIYFLWPSFSWFLNVLLLSDCCHLHCLPIA